MVFLNSIIIRYWTLFCVVNCASLSYSFVNSSRGGGVLPEELAYDKTDITEENVASVIAGKRPHKKNCSTLEVYNKTPIFIPVDIVEDVVKSVA